MNTVPYTNAARAGRTHHGLIEMLDNTDPRLRNRQPKPPRNRAGRRARGLYAGATVGAPYRRVRSLRTISQFPTAAKDSEA